MTPATQARRPRTRRGPGRPGYRAAALLVPLAMPLVAAVAPATTLSNRIVAVVDREAITLSEVERGADLIRRALPSSVPDDVLKQRALEELIEREVVRARMRELGLSVSDQEIDDTLRRSLGDIASDPAELDRVLEREGISKDQYRDRLRTQLESRKLIDLEVRPHVVVADSEIEAYYREHVDDYEVPRRVHLRDLYLPFEGGDREGVERRAEELLSMARHGVSFQELASNHSKGPGADEGGDIGTFRPGELRPELEAVAFELDAGEVGGPVESGGGLHLLEVAEVLPGGPRPLEEVKGEIREKLMSSTLERTYRRWIERVREGVHIERRETFANLDALGGEAAEPDAP